MSKEELAKEWNWEFNVWMKSFQSPPVELVCSEDLSESYERNSATIFKLEDGKYALVIECGCSCYDPIDASIELFPTEEKAIESFDKWVKESSR